jgi:hypothetical protein
MPKGPMTREERRAYDRKKRAASALVYFRDVEEKAEFMRLAENEGEPVFSRWIIQKILVALSGTVYAPGYVEQLQADLAKYREWLASRDAQIAELRKDLRAVEAEREDLRVIVAAMSGDAAKANSARRD